MVKRQLPMLTVIRRTMVRSKIPCSFYNQHLSEVSVVREIKEGLWAVPTSHPKRDPMLYKFSEWSEEPIVDTKPKSRKKGAVR